MPTGGGKSLTFQLPALISKGVTIVIMPLISLISDQMIQMRNLKINAIALSASLNYNQMEEMFNDILNRRENSMKILYMTPEKYSKSNWVFGRLKNLYEENLIDRFVIDEAHCVSQWGHEFRKDYLELSQIRKFFPGIPLLALTATATENVRIDIIKQLNMDKKTLYFQSSFNRPNLFYEIIQKKRKRDTHSHISDLIHVKFRNKCGLIYCHSVKDSFEMTNYLRSRGISACCYNSKMKENQRNLNQEKWMKGEIKVIVATIAFGMGINKSNVRFVIHLSLIHI